MQKNNISKRLWGNIGSADVYLFKMINKKGAFVEVSNYGATLVSVNTYNKEGNLGNVILGFPLLQSYIEDEHYIGSTVGPFANRIANASFGLDGTIFQLEQNDGPNNNHSGSAGFNKKVFSYDINEDTLIFHLLSADGTGGFPGNMNFSISYRWTENNELDIEYRAVTDKKTIANFTNHAYFNLTADGGKIFDHELSISSDLVVSAGSDYIPTGLFEPAADLTFKNNKIREKLISNDFGATGLNTCYFLDKNNAQENPCAAVLYDEKSGRVMEVYTSYPGLMLYTGDFLSSITPGNHLKTYEPFDGLCLECQYFPDSPNHLHFPSTELNPGEVYRENITFKFSIKP